MNVNGGNTQRNNGTVRQSGNAGGNGAKFWVEDWIAEKQSGTKKKGLTIYDEIWNSGGFTWGNKWMLKYWGVWLFIVLVVGPWMIGEGSILWTSITAAIEVGMVFVFFYIRKKALGGLSVNTDEETALVYRLFERCGALKKTSEYDDWTVYYNGEESEQAKYGIICREPGVDLFAIKNKLEMEAPKLRTPSGRAVKEVFITKRDTAHYDLILDYREKTDSEIIDWFGWNEDLPYWEMPRTEEGYLRGIFAFGAVDKGPRYGQAYTGTIYGKHIGVSGISGYGKSNTVHFLLYQLAQMNNAQIIYIDPQGTDGAFWTERAIVIEGAKDSLQALDTLDKIMDERGAIMKRNGWAKWECTPRNPLLVVVVDEIKFLADEDKNIPHRLAHLAAVARKFGISLIYATQYPKKEYVKGAWENMSYRISSKTNSPIETQVVFGSKANLAPCENITEHGEFYVDGPGNMGLQHIRVPLCNTEWAEDMAKETAKYKDNNLAKRFGVGNISYTHNENEWNANSSPASVDDIFADIWG